MAKGDKTVLAKASDPAIISTVLVVSNKDENRAVDLAGGTNILQYYESILADTVRVSVNYTDTGHTVKSEDDDTVMAAVEGLPIVGTETVKVVIEDNNENEIDMVLYINKVSPIKETSKVNTVNLELVSKEFIMNEKIRVNTRFDGKISDHVTKIIQDIPEYFNTFEEIDIEMTDNNYNFIGNNRKPFFVLNTLSKKAVPDGKLGKSAGFFFWQTSEGFQFKSIDTLLDPEKNPIKKAILYDNTPDSHGASIPPAYDMKALEYSEDNRVNIKEKMSLGAYATKIITFDPRTCEYKVTTRTVKDEGTKVGKGVPQDEGSENNLTTGGEELPVLNPIFDRVGLDKNYSRTTYYVEDTGTLPTGTGLGEEQQQLDKSRLPNFIQSQIVNQSVRRYNQFYASQVTITIPGDFSLHAGDAMFVDAPAVTADKSKGEVNQRTGGLYIITDLCHYVSSDGTYTKLNLVRDSFGRQGTPLKG
tara:strand:- start:182 stop:1603 length:1422 start_codon:yes stop_codon:yes gene_type:complete